MEMQTMQYRFLFKKKKRFPKEFSNKFHQEKRVLPD